MEENKKTKEQNFREKMKIPELLYDGTGHDFLGNRVDDDGDRLPSSNVLAERDEPFIEALYRDLR